MIFRNENEIKIGMEVEYSGGNTFRITDERLLKKVKEEYWEYEPIIRNKTKKKK